AKYDSVENLVDDLGILLVVLRVVVPIQLQIVQKYAEPVAGRVVRLVRRPATECDQHLQHRATEIQPVLVDLVDSLIVKKLVSKISSILDTIVIIGNEPDELLGVELPGQTPI